MMHVILFEVISAILFFIIISLVFYLWFLKFIAKFGTLCSVQILIASAGEKTPKENVFRACKKTGNKDKLDGDKKYLVYSYTVHGMTKTGYSRVRYDNADALVGKTSDVYIYVRKGREFVYFRPDMKYRMKRVMWLYLRLIMVWLCCFILFLISVLCLHSF